MKEYDSEDQMISMNELLWKLPLFDGVYLSMQGQNIMMVDFYLRDLERHLLRELIDREKTPVPDALFVSALSQMWVFAVYELLRTWRQLVRDLKRSAAEPAQEVPEEDKEHPAGVLAQAQWRSHLKAIREHPELVDELDEAGQAIEPVFRRIESLRMNLAKHEVPKRKGVPAMAPGYGRIDYSDGSIYWMVDLGDNVVDMVSRRSISNEMRRVVIGEKDAEDGADLDYEGDGK